MAADKYKSGLGFTVEPVRKGDHCYSVTYTWDESKPVRGMIGFRYIPSLEDGQSFPVMWKNRLAPAWSGYGGCQLVNLYTKGAESFESIRGDPDAIGPENMIHIAEAASLCDTFIIGWGIDGCRPYANHVLRTLSLAVNFATWGFDVRGNPRDHYYVLTEPRLYQWQPNL